MWPIGGVCVGIEGGPPNPPEPENPEKSVTVGAGCDKVEPENPEKSVTVGAGCDEAELVKPCGAAPNAFPALKASDPPNALGAKPELIPCCMLVPNPGGA